MNIISLEQYLIADKSMQVSVDSFYKMGPNVRKIEGIKVELKDEKVHLKCLELPRVWTGDPKQKIRLKVDIKATLEKYIYWLSKKDCVIRQTKSKETVEISVLLTERDVADELPIGFEFCEDDMFAQVVVNDIVVDYIEKGKFKKPKPKHKIKPDVVRDKEESTIEGVNRHLNNMEIYIDFTTNVFQNSSNPYV